MVADTTALMIAVYSEHGVRRHQPVRQRAGRRTRRCDLTLLTALDLPWQADGLQRDGPHVREPVDALVRAALARAAIDSRWCSAKVRSALPTHWPRCSARCIPRRTTARNAGSGCAIAAATRDASATGSHRSDIVPRPRDPDPMAHACFECRTENADGATFCRACGVPMAALSADLPESDSLQALHCEDCGHRNPPGSTYCERCGYGLVALLSLGAPPATASTAAPAMAPAPETQAPPSEGAPTLAPPLPAAWRSAAAPDEDTFDPLSAPTLVMSHTAPSPLPPLEPSMSVRRGPRPLRWVAAGLGLLAVFALLAWLAGPSVAAGRNGCRACTGGCAGFRRSTGSARVAGLVARAGDVRAGTGFGRLAGGRPCARLRTGCFGTGTQAGAEPVARKRALEAPAARSEPAPAPAPPPRHRSSPRHRRRHRSGRRP